MINQFNQFIPISIKIIILKKKTTLNPHNLRSNKIKNDNLTLLYLYDKIKFLKIPISEKIHKNKIFINSNTNSIKIYKAEIFNWNKINSIFRTVLKSKNNYFFLKIKFKGKGYKIRLLKSNKIIKFFFGYSHIKMLFLQNISCYRINKYKFILKNIQKNDLIKTGKEISFIKKINKFTGRGLRLSRSNFIKRKGSKGSWIY